MPKKKIPESRLRAAAIAREAWMVKKRQSSVQARLRIPSKLLEVWEKQDTGDRGSTWADGYEVKQQLWTFYRVIEALSGCGLSVILDGGVTLIVGQKSFEADSHLEALLKAIVYYLPPEIILGDLEQRLKDLELLEE